MNEILSRPISPLRQRMLDEMRIRQFSEKTQSDYIRHVKALADLIGRSPASATPDDLRAFQVRQRQAGVQPPTMNSSVSALRFFFTFVCDRPELGRYLRIVKQPQKLPVVLTQEEAAQLMAAAPGAKFRAIFGVAYGAGLQATHGMVVLTKLAPDCARDHLLQQCECKHIMRQAEVGIVRAHRCHHVQAAIAGHELQRARARHILLSEVAGRIDLDDSLTRVRFASKQLDDAINL